jgi:cell division protein FtsL
MSPAVANRGRRRTDRTGAEPRRRPIRRQARGGRRPGWIAALGWLIVMLGSLVTVTWRQTQGLALERELRDLEAERAVLETEQVTLGRRVEELRSRSRVLRVARERLGMRLPEENEIVFLPVAAGDAGILAAPVRR